MLEFLQTYGVWILLGLFFIAMMRSHGSHGGMGCGMGNHDHESQSTTGTTGGTARRDSDGTPAKRDEAGIGTGESTPQRRPGGCH